MRKRFAALLAPILLLLPLFGCKQLAYNPKVINTATPTVAAVATAPIATPTPSPREMDLLFTGDIMYPGAIVQMQWDEQKKEYNFRSYFERLETYIQQADFSIGNFEAPVWDLKKSVLGTYRFAAPVEAVRDLSNAGFDVLITANNHALDQGFPALAKTIETIEDNGMKATGTYRDERERDEVLLLEKNGFRVALFAYARFSNLEPVKSGSMGLNITDESRMKKDITRAREQGADAVIFFMHFGNQYIHEPNRFQKNIVKTLKEAGADAVIGCHPHVLQPLLLEEDGSFLTAYSLGNIVPFRYTMNQQYAAMMRFTIGADESTGKVKITNLSYIPTWAKATVKSGEKSKMRVFDLRQALLGCEEGTDEYLKKEYLLEIQKGMEVMKTVLGLECMAKE